MKKILFFCLLFIGINSIKSQTYELNFDAKVIKSYGSLKKGTIVHIKSMKHEVVYGVEKSINEKVTITTTNSKPLHTYILETDQGDVTVKDKLEQVLEVDYKDAQNFWDVQIIFNVLEQLSKKGIQEDLRAEMEDDALEYINRVQLSGLAFDDPYLESYIYGVISKLVPSVLIDGRPGNVNLLIVSNPTANAAMFPNGSLLITTGLISLLHSEEELAAVLAHEIAHFVLDHSVQNYNKMQTRIKRAEFWAGFATVMTGVAEGVAAVKNPYYIPGGATIAVAAASSQIALEVCKRLGMEYNRAQESEADELAVELMNVMGYDSNALATALSRIEDTMKQERSIEMYFASDHPALVDRIKKAGTPSNKRDKDFEKIISFAVSNAASMKIQDRRFRQALPLLSQNISNNVAVADDYIQKANCLLYLRNDNNAYTEVNSLIKEAKVLAPDNINIYKPEILVLLRNKDYKKATALLLEYKERLSKMMVIDNNLPEDIWSNAYRFANSEFHWAENMAVKLRSF